LEEVELELNASQGGVRGKSASSGWGGAASSYLGRADFRKNQDSMNEKDHDYHDGLRGGLSGPTLHVKEPSGLVRKIRKGGVNRHRRRSMNFAAWGVSWVSC